MPLIILELGKQFRPATSQTYPPFKKGRYMEEYFYEWALAHKDEINSDLVYIPIFWTNLQNHPAFTAQKNNYDMLLSMTLKKLPSTTRYFTVVQHDDGPQLTLPHTTIVFGACTGTIPLPLIYEDINNTLCLAPRLQEKKYLASFVGTTTHALRNIMKEALSGHEDIFLGVKDKWTASVPQSQADLFVQTTLNSKFCLAPRGYGQSSFRFFEAMLLDTIPVYFWDDKQWLPYREKLDYSKFAVSIQEKYIPRTYEILKSISEQKYVSMLEELKKVRHWFSLEGMSEYILSQIEKQKTE